jgi:PilZ domain
VNKKSSQCHRTMWSCEANVTMSVPTGRSERRIARAVAVEICLEDEAMLKERASTENVSAHGVRVLIRRKLPPGQPVLAIFPREGVRSPGQVVYCQPLAEPKFAVGLELFVPVDWARLD